MCPKISCPHYQCGSPSLAERIRATEQALHATAHPLTAAELAGLFARASGKDLQEILETLVAMGRARQTGEKFGV